MIKEVAKDIYTFNVDMPQTALKQLNIFVIKTPERNVIFDTGYNLPETKEQLLAGIAELGLEVGDLDLVITHLHADHSGLAYLFQEAGCRIYAGEVDGEIINRMVSDQYWETISERQAAYTDQMETMDLSVNPGYAFKSNETIDFIPLKIGETFNVGQYQFEVMDLIGHTPGHIGLYEPNYQFIFSADTVLDPISPNITYWGEEYPNILNDYLKTLEHLKPLNLKRMFATHRQLIDRPNRRIDEIISHHHERLQEILDAMSEGMSYTVEDISRQISWRVKFDKWENFPKSQKFFATGETMAHLDYLVHSGHVLCEIINGVYHFQKVEATIQNIYKNVIV